MKSECLTPAVTAAMEGPAPVRLGAGRLHFCYNREQWSSSTLPLHHFQKSSIWELGMIMFVDLKTADVPVQTGQTGSCQTSPYPLCTLQTVHERHLVYGLDTGYDLTSFDKGDPIYRRNS